MPWRRPFFSDFVEDKVGEREFDGEVFTLQDHISELYREGCLLQEEAEGLQRYRRSNVHGVPIRDL